jgi:hypothetical protein
MRSHPDAIRRFRGNDSGHGDSEPGLAHHPDRMIDASVGAKITSSG